MALENHEQYSRRLNLLFDNIDESEVNVIDGIIEKCELLNVTLSVDDVEVTHRVGKKLLGKNWSVFVQACMKKCYEIIYSTRYIINEKRKNEPFEGIPFISKHLTPFLVSLFKSTREL